MTDEEIVQRFLAGESPWKIASDSYVRDGEGSVSEVTLVIRRHLLVLTDELRVVYEGTVDMRRTP